MVRDIRGRLEALERRLFRTEGKATLLHRYHATGELPSDLELADEIQDLAERLRACKEAMDATIPSAQPAAPVVSGGA